MQHDISLVLPLLDGKMLDLDVANTSPRRIYSFPLLTLQSVNWPPVPVVPSAPMSFGVLTVNAMLLASLLLFLLDDLLPDPSPSPFCSPLHFCMLLFQAH